MGFWAKLFGREVDTTVADYQASVPTGGPFRMTVEDVFFITGRGTVVTGRVESGTVRVGDVLKARHPDGRILQTTVTGLEAFQRKLDVAGEGELIGVLVDLSKQDVSRGSVLER